jgi:hypothetical protein
MTDGHFTTFLLSATLSYLLFCICNCLTMNLVYAAVKKHKNEKKIYSGCGGVKNKKIYENKEV